MKSTPPRIMYTISTSHFRSRNHVSQNRRWKTWCMCRPRTDTTTRQRGMPTRAYITQNKRPNVVAGARYPYPVKQKREKIRLGGTYALRWRHNGCDSVSNHQPHDCLLNRLFRRRSKKTSKLRVTGLCAGNSPGTGEFPAQIASYAENVSIWWRHHGLRWFDTCPYRACYALSLLPSYSLYRYTGMISAHYKCNCSRVSWPVQASSVDCVKYISWIKVIVSPRFMFKDSVGTIATDLVIGLTDGCDNCGTKEDSSAVLPRVMGGRLLRSSQENPFTKCIIGCSQDKLQFVGTQTSIVLWQ